MPLFRMTRPEQYRAGTTGHHNRLARTPYYIQAESLEAATAEMRRAFPNDHRIEGELWIADGVTSGRAAYDKR